MSVKGTPRSYLGNRLCHDHTFEISANVGNIDMTERVVLMSLKARNASRDGLVKYVVGICLHKL